MKPFNVEIEEKSIIFKNQKIDFEMTIYRLRPSIDYVIDELKKDIYGSLNQQGLMTS